MEPDIFSQLRLLETDQLHPYESVRLLEDRMTVDLDEISLLRHPFLVTALDDDDYLLLEETEQFHALTEAGLAHVPVQVCPPERLTPLTSLIGLTGFDRGDLEYTTARYADQIRIEARETEGPVAKGFLTLTFEFPDQSPLSVHLRHTSRLGCPAALELLFRAILSRGRYLPTVEHDDTAETITRLTSFSATVKIPAFSLDDLKTAATADRLFPPGIARVESTWRALNIDFPLSVLTSPIPIEEKQRFLRELILLRHRARRTSSYQGRIYLLNR
ncbi:MAG: hypothetical protein KAW46_00495 [candidate division Zixibacteria bacterium]|nr:hypothetical protein [candidate division Zixibacteria bacterium]